jgi:Leucine-rich repeat (LRR) protein
MSFFNNKIENFIINSQNCILKVLEISNNNLYEIPRDFYNLNELISLSIEGNYINLIPEKINNLKNLVTLMISCNPIQQIDTDFSQLTKLKYLIIDYYHFEKIKNFDKLKQKVEIKDLSMKNDLQIQLNYNYREIFEYDQNCLKDIIAKFGLIPLIEVDDDKYNSIDVGIGVKDHHIISIRLPHKNLKEFPLSICNIVTLKELILDENFIEKIPIKINYLNQLEIFSISRNLLTSLPKINQWSNLKKLILDNNKLIEIPISISELKQIEEINIAGNLIQELPDIFYNFSLLKILLIEDNPLKSVPDSIGFCRKLKILNFGSAMHHLSPWLISLTELEEFTFGGSFQNEPLEILKYVFHNNLDEAYFNKKKDIKNFQKRLQNILDGTAP